MIRAELLKVAKPVLFATDMVRAILDGRKTVTRRICKDGNDYTVPDMDFYDADKRTYAIHNYANLEHTEKLSIAERALPICPGDILYVRETIWQKTGHYLDMDGETKAVFLNEFKYAATDEKPEVGWNYSWVKRPSIHMPKEAARIFLGVTDVRVERLQDITQLDIMNEGVNTCEKCGCKDLCLGLSDARICYLKSDFIKLWNSTIKKTDIEQYGWNANPWVWLIEFERIREE